MPFFRYLARLFISRSLAQRDFALDVLRGLLIGGMILVNHPPPNVPVYSPFVHAVWHGWTLADTIFPGFLFAVGVSIRLSMTDAQGQSLAPNGAVYHKLMRRFGLLLAINFLLMNFPYYFAGTLHFTGTLALIAWCYLFAALTHLHCAWRTQLTLVIVALLMQWAAFAMLPVPEIGTSVLTSDGNAGTYIDRLVFTSLFGLNRGDERDVVILPMLGAVATTLISVLAGHWLRSARALPVNKQLWTASYVVLMAGIAMQLLAAISWMTEHCGYRAWAVPLQIAGVSALFYYVFAQSLQRVLVYGRLPTADGGLPTADGVIRLRHLVYERFFAPWISGELGALAFVLVFTSICYAAVLVLYRNRLFIKL